MLQEVQQVWQRVWKYETAVPQYCACHKIQDSTLNGIIRKGCIPQCQAKNCCQVWMLIDSHGRHIHSSHRGKVGCGEGGKTKLILRIFPTPPVKKSALNSKTESVLTWTGLLPVS